MGHIDDRWTRIARDGQGKPIGKEHTARWGNGKRWMARWLDPDGRECARSFATKPLAERFLVTVEGAKLAGTYRDPDAGRVGLRRYALEWLAAQSFDPVTRETAGARFRNHVLGDGQLGGRTLAELEARPSIVQAWVSGLRLAPSTAAAVFSLLNSVMIAAQTDRLITVNPCKGISLPRPPRRRLVLWTPEQTAAVRAALPERWRVMEDAGTGLGLRQSEIFGLAEDEIGFLDQRVEVRLQVKVVERRLCFALPKGGKERTVPLARPTSLALFDHAAQYAREVTLPWHEPGTRRHGRDHTARLLFTMDDGRAITRSRFNTLAWRPARAAAGLPGGRENGMHMLRHLYASTLIAAGVDVGAVSEHLGHCDGGALVLRTYRHLMPDAEERTRRALESALAGQDHGTVTDQEGPQR